MLLRYCHTILSTCACSWTIHNYRLLDYLRLLSVPKLSSPDQLDMHWILPNQCIYWKISKVYYWLSLLGTIPKQPTHLYDLTASLQINIGEVQLLQIDHELVFCFSLALLDALGAHVLATASRHLVQWYVLIRRFQSSAPMCRAQLHMLALLVRKKDPLAFPDLFKPFPTPTWRLKAGSGVEAAFWICQANRVGTGWIQTAWLW